jgi:tetratricopeptide (TPR) repeat protein
MLHPERPADGPAAKARLLQWLWALGGVVVLLLVAATVAIWFWAEQTQPESALDDDDLEQLPAVANPGYLGIESCAECHARRVALVKTTRHYLACTPATGVAAPGFTAGRGRYDTRVPGLRFEMTRSGDDFLATAVQATKQGEQRVSYKIGLVYGSANKRDEMYFTWQDDHIHHLPVAWLYPQDRWGDARETLEVGNAPPSCLECHNTWMTHVPEKPMRYRRDEVLLGVTCERCHGPGREHVEYHRQHPKDEAHAILHPGTLSRDRLMDLCAQCHANTRMLRGLFSYRPGEPIEGCYRIVKARFREDDTTTNQVQYLSESKCFQKSKMTCITCHNPHRLTSAQTVCMKCHTAASCADHPRQPPGVRGDCIGCHMPRHIWMNSHYYTTTEDCYLPVAPRSEHRIAVYPQAKLAVVLAWLRKQRDAASRAEAERLTAQLAEHWLNEAEQFRRADRLKAAIGAYREALQVADNPKARQRMQQVIARQTELDDLFTQAADAERRAPDKAIGLLTRLLELRPNEARAHGKLGAIYAMRGLRDEAIPHLRAVAKCEPNDSSGLTRLAWMANVEGRPQDASALCAEADKIEPGHPANQYVWGMALLKQQRLAEAEQKFRKALEIHAAHEGANEGLSEALRRQGQAKEAIHFARRAVQASNAKNVAALLTLAEAYIGAKHPLDARKTLERALAVAEKTNHPLVEGIRKRLQQLE